MRVLIAPDKFKGCLPAAAVCSAIAEGVLAADPRADVDQCPMADGGEGTVAALVAATKGELITRRVTGPLPHMKVDASFGILGDGHTAVIEMAAASGLALLAPQDRNPMNTTTYGTGELMLTAAQMGAKRIILGIGGSATVDGGIGCAQACGLPVILEAGEAISDTDPLVGADLERVVLVKHGRGSPIDGIEIVVASDVDNPLYGPQGAAETYGPQKGASPEQVHQLDHALQQLARRLHAEHHAETPGAGAAGGLGFAMLAMFGATLMSGIDVVIDAVRMRERLNATDLCITGEGRLDATSLHGKTTVGVARVCKSLSVPCVALVGQVGPGADAIYDVGLTAYLAISDGPRSFEHSLANAPDLLRITAANLARIWKSSNRYIPSSPMGSAVFAQTPIDDPRQTQ